MTVFFEGDENHAIETHLYMQSQRKSHRKSLIHLRRIGWILAILSTSLLVLCLIRFSLTNAMIGFLYSFFAYLLLNQKKMQRKAIEQVVKEGGAQTLLGPHEYTLTPQGIQHKSRHSDGLLPWSGLTEIRMTETHLAFHFSDVQAFLIPKSAFADDSQWMRFLQQAEQLRGQSTGQSTTAPEASTGNWWTQGSAVTEDEAETQRLRG